MLGKLGVGHRVSRQSDDVGGLSSQALARMFHQLPAGLCRVPIATQTSRVEGLRRGRPKVRHQGYTRITPLPRCWLFNIRNSIGFQYMQYLITAGFG
jgi:hypothetical protein